MSFEIKPASRSGVIPIIDMYSESGCGKTYSSLLLARGIAGPKGRIVLADSESGRGSLYADVLPGGYDVINFGAPFTPAVYREVLETMWSSGAAVGIIDSASHEWEGLGGVLDMAGENEEKSGKAGLHNWKTPKMEHAKFMQMLLRSPIPLICCIRAKFKTRQAKENGRTVIIKDDYPSPIQSEEFIFESTAHALILPDHSIKLTKCSHPKLKECFPTSGPITIQHGEAIARWCAAPTASATAPATATSKPKTDPTLAKLKKHLWDMTIHIHNGTPDKLQQWLVDEMVLSPEQTMTGLNAVQMAEVIGKVEDKLGADVIP